MDDALVALARVYADAEHALTRRVAAEVVRTLDAGPSATAVQAEAVQSLRRDAQHVLSYVNREVPPLARAVIEAATTSGTRAAQRELVDALGRPTNAEPFARHRLDALAAGALDTITPAHAAMLRTVPDTYRQVIQRAAPGLIVGADTRRQAAQRAMAEFARIGVTGFTDKAGRRWELTTYVEMTLRTTAARSATDAQAAKLLAEGYGLVMSTDSPMECALCRPFEGRVLALTGPPGPRQVRIGRRTIDVVDTLDGARARGYQHPNCGHAVFLFIPGVTKAPTGPGTGPDPEGHAARQRQRAIEREIRHYKRRASGALDAAAKKKANAYVKAWKARMVEHLAANPDLRRLTYRESPGAGNTPSPELLAEDQFPDLATP